jgi:hypothetical protein
VCLRFEKQTQKNMEAGDKQMTLVHVEAPGDTPAIVNITIGRPHGRFTRRAKCAFWLAFMIAGIIGLGAYMAFTFMRA